LAPIADLQAANTANLGGGALRDFIGGSVEERFDLDPARLPSPLHPTILFSGALDDEVPPAMSDGYLRAHPGVDSRVLESVGHYEFIDPNSAVWPTIVATLRAVSQGL
jgi:pimeloyl-ACP methyl ester carboxylesterase